MNWVVTNWSQVSEYGLAHIWLSIPPIVLGFLISVPIGWVANRYRLSRGVVLTIAGILYAIPSLPLFTLLPSLIGTRILDPINVEIALTLYAVALMVRTTADALAAVSDDVKLSASAIGFGLWRRFFGVELPLAGPVLLAGLRVVSVSTVSLVTVGSVIGINSLGFFFLDGYQRAFPTEVWVGIIGTVLIALAFDVLLVLLGRWLMPWTRRQGGATRNLAVVQSETAVLR
ncbi:ABC transporter permease [Gryllotalpicola protaetiae]|uniref:ABC transporter permease subunit n=1 Tax=Gryllotalpicola protaetiae TaxID=2419771 RepID=A0A387BMQ5_9MICO|nr:ABC transporter permease subunit [Gryllotalpicola protaetiae]AYG05103.1 ABC transporter permease subunit [Gryllotalpicola protaetiae]